MREWSIKIFIVGPDGEELPANCFDKVTYKLHESFGPRAKQGELNSFPILPVNTSPLRQQTQPSSDRFGVMYSRERRTFPNL